MFKPERPPFWDSHCLLYPWFRSWRGCRSRKTGIGPPLTSVLQAENKHHAAHGFFVFPSPF